MNYEKLNTKQKKQVAKGFDATPELVPYIPYLLQDLWELGAFTHFIIDILKNLKLPVNTKLLDLACGKGATSLQISQQLGFNCLGIDLYEPFINEAKKKSVELNLSDKCKFKVEDINDAVENYRDYDVVILASAETLLGNPKQMMKTLRDCVKISGYIIYDAAFLQDNAKLDNPEYASLKGYDETKKLLISFGDEIVAERIVSFNETKNINDTYTELIRKRAEELAQKHPGEKSLFLDYVKKQESECELIEKYTTSAIWCIQKVSNS